MTLFEDSPEPPLTGVYRENYQRKLANEPCRHCRQPGNFQTFYEPNNNAVGLLCLNCGRKHPLSHRRIMWLPNAIR